MSGRENMGGENTGGKPDAPSVVVSLSIIGEMPDSFEGEKKEEKKKFKSFADAMSVKQALQKGEKAVSVENAAVAETQELEKHIKHSLAVGQKWQTKNGRSCLEITQQRKDGTLGIARSVRTDKNKDAWTHSEKVEFLKSQDVEKELLLEKYTLISGTAILLDRADEVRASALDKEMSVILEKEINPASSGIAWVLEENADALGDQQYQSFFDDLDRISALIKDIFEQEDHLYNDIKKNDREVVAVIQEMKERLIGLHEELKRLRVSIDRAIKEADAKNKKEFFGGGNVVDIAHYRKMSKSASTSEPAAPLKQVVEKSQKAKEKDATSIEARIGEEKYEAICALMSDAWQGLYRALGENNVLVADRNNVWKTLLLPLLKEKINDFLQKQTDLAEDEYEAVMTALITKKGLPVKRILSRGSNPQDTKHVE